MTGYHISVPSLTRRQLATFVKAHLLTLDEVLRRAERAKLPHSCRQCGETLAKRCTSYCSVSRKSQAIVFPMKPQLRPGALGPLSQKVIDQNFPQVMLRTGGSGDCNIMDNGICKIVYNHLVRELRSAGYRCCPCIV